MKRWMFALVALLLAGCASPPTETSVRADSHPTDIAGETVSRLLTDVNATETFKVWRSRHGNKNPSIQVDYIQNRTNQRRHDELERTKAGIEQALVRSGLFDVMATSTYSSSFLMCGDFRIFQDGDIVTESYMFQLLETDDARLVWMDTIEHSYTKQ